MVAVIFQVGLPLVGKLRPHTSKVDMTMAVIRVGALMGVPWVC